jgi:hypothetical protein
MGLANEINQRSSSPAAAPILLQTRRATLTQPPGMYVSEPFMNLQNYGRVRSAGCTSVECNRTHSGRIVHGYMETQGFVWTSTLFLRNSYFRWHATRIAIDMATEVPESTSIDKRIDMRLDTVYTDIITICRRSTDLQNRGWPSRNAKNHRYPCKEGWRLQTLNWVPSFQYAQSWIDEKRLLGGWHL